MRRQVITTATLGLVLFAWALGASGASAAPPAILNSSFTPISTGSVILRAEINPGEKATNYHFEYGAADCSANSCIAIPLPDGKIPTGKEPVTVTVEVGGLSAASSYHFRVAAKNAESGGYIFGPDQVFATFATSFEGLSDSRAYEQVSPVNKNAVDALDTFPFAKAASGGGGFAFLSTSGIPGGVGAQELPLYLGSRQEGSWSSQGLLPPASLGQRARVIGWLPDFSEFIQIATKFGNPRSTTLLARAAQGGEESVIVPYAQKAQYSYVGASAKGAELAFESETALKTEPAGQQGRSNVYAWDKASGKLSLADVLNTKGQTEAALPKGAFAGPYDWALGTTQKTLSEGGAARSYYTQDEHAITADGSIYFTAAGTGQLYLRRNPTREQSLLDEQGKCTNPNLACTFHVSGSQRGTPDPLGPRPAVFMSATADGSTAFFTSPEKLTDDATTGPEREVPPPPAIERSNLEGKEIEEELIPATRGDGIALDGAHLYWADSKTGAIERSNLEGKEVEKEFIAGINPVAVAVDGAHIYWADLAGSIGRADINGGEVKPSFIADTANPQGVAVDSEHVYWTNQESHSIGRAKIDGGGVEENFVELCTCSFPRAIAVDATQVVYSQEESDVHKIERVNLDGSHADPPISIEIQAEATGLALDANHLYWAEPANGTIGRSGPHYEEPREEAFLTGVGAPHGVAVNASHIYWSSVPVIPQNPGNDLYEFDAKSGALSDLISDPGEENGAEVKGVLGMSADGSYIYFAANGMLPGSGATTHGECAGESFTGLSGACNLYLYHAGQASFIARLDVSGGGLQSDASNWVGTASGVFPGEPYYSKTARVSGDGQALLFRSQSQLGNYDNQGHPEFYLYRVDAAEPLVCVTCDPTGAAPVGGANFLGGLINPSTAIPSPPAATFTRNLTDEGRRIFFETTQALVPADRNGREGCPAVGAGGQGFPACLDAYEWEAPDAGSCSKTSPAYSPANGGCLYLLSSGKSTYPSFFGDASESGDDAFIFTREGLVGQDEDELLDVYDVRAGGGIATQNPPSPPPPCEGAEACHGPASQAPAVESPASTGFQGPADPKPKRAHKKKGHKKKAHKKQKQHRAKAKGRGTR